jgi:hypothetical protein
MTGSGAPATPDPAIPEPATPDAAAPAPGDQAARDTAAVTARLGRPPAGDFTVACRDAAGQPMVIVNAPYLRDGTPMPTRYWLVDPALREAVSRLEAAGGVRQAEAEVDPTALVAAHRRYAAERDALVEVAGPGRRPSGGVGGTARGVKCLHAHLAWWLAGGDDPVGDWVAARLGIGRRGDEQPQPAS